MHRPSEYMAVFSDCYMKARELVEKLVKVGFSTEKRVFDFLGRHCYFAYPEKVGQFKVGQWLYRPGKPASQSQGVAWIMCFSDDTAPIERHNDGSVQPACFNQRAQAIVLFDADIWSPLEQALFLLHEGYHAWHRLSQKLDGTPSPDKEETQETNAWILTINLLQAGGGQAWQEIVKKEMRKLQGSKLNAAKKNPNRIMFTESITDWPEFATVFGPTKNEGVKKSRRFLASLNAHMNYWAQRGLTAENVCHAVISEKYKE